MPEFIINDCAAPRAYYALSDFAKGYVEAMFFTNGDCGDDDEFILNRLGVERLTRQAIVDIAADCDKFLGTILSDGCFVQQWIMRACEEHSYTEDRAGNDFWYTRQGHGVGYWDRDLGEIGDTLADAARQFGEATVEQYRGWIYHR